VVDRFEYLKACDLVVCRGGHNTIMQSICYGRPSIIIPVPGHTEQYANARRARELGFSEVLHQRDLSREPLLEITDRMLSDVELRERLDDISLKGYTNGLENAIKAISELIQS
jgi:uncharacterized protein (TIGR00661 family)